MKRRYFGTDGIRGQANAEPVTAELALKLGMAAGSIFRPESGRSRVVIAKDTRLSGYLLEPALTAGFISVGMDVILVGPMPTPAVAMLVRSLRADLGVMISASHNPYCDNGIKLFGPDGFKLSDDVEHRIEARMDEDLGGFRAESARLGRGKRLDDAKGRYIEYVKSTFPRGLRLDGLKIVIDCAHGAAYQIGPTVLWELGAEVVAIGVSPDGFNVNRDCGSTHPAALQAAVLEHGAHLGVALDGDADRLIVVDEAGRVVDGDQLMAMVATVMHRHGMLKGDAVVATVMSNSGLEEYLRGLGLGLHRTAVGDRYVMEKMRESGCNFGGEQSGHLILSDYATTGDGLLAALQVLALLVEQGGKASEATRCFTPWPQQLVNIRYAGATPLENPDVRQAIESAQERMDGQGRVFIRASGTEPLIRVMVEAKDAAVLEREMDGLKRVIEASVT